jgi:hypothetical protein
MVSIRAKLTVCVQYMYSAKSRGSDNAVLTLTSIRQADWNNDDNIIVTFARC